MTEKTIWGVHMDWSLELVPYSTGFIAIGWGELGDLSKIDATREAFKARLISTYNSKPGAVPVNAGVLFRFVHEMKAGDLIVYPSKPNRMVNLGTIEGDYTFDSTNVESYPNRRRVKWLRQMPRTEFSADALHEIGSFITLFKISNNADEFVAAFEGQEIQHIETDFEVAEAVSTQAEESAADFIIKKLKSGINPYQFEEFVGHRSEAPLSRPHQNTAASRSIVLHRMLGRSPPFISRGAETFPKSAISRQRYAHVDLPIGRFVMLGKFTADAHRIERAKRNLRLTDGKGLLS